MWHYEENVITKQNANILAKEDGYKLFTDILIEPIIKIIKKIIPIDISKPSYCLVESRSRGHDWHTDKGTNNHMSWCKYSASILLTNPDNYRGGHFLTRDKIIKKAHYLSMLLYSSDIEHKVESFDGNRKALLMFFK